MALPMWIDLQEKRLKARLNTGARQNTPPASSNDLLHLYTDAIEQVYAARTAFTQDARNALTTMFVTFSAGGALLLAWLSAGHPRHWAITLVMGVVAIVVFSLPLILNRNWIKQVQTSYQIYVAAGVHAAVVAQALDIPATHPWHADALESELATGQLQRRRRATGSRRKGQWTELDANSTADLPEDELRFIRDQSARKAPLNSVERITAVWESSERTFYSTYKSMLLRSIPVMGLIFALGTAGLLSVAMLAPGKFWPKPASFIVPDEPVSVKVTRNMQPAPTGTKVRIAHGIDYPLNSYGEVLIPASARGRRYEVLNPRGVVVALGIVPSEGMLIERLD